MIEFASHIIQQLVKSAGHAFQELIYPVAVENDYPEEVQRLSLQASNDLPRGPVHREAPITAAVGIIKQAVVVVMLIEQLPAEAAFRRAMAQISQELSSEMEVLIDEDRPEQYADCSSFIADDKFNVAIMVATGHLVSTAARHFATFDAAGLEDFITSELQESNTFLLPDRNAIKAAARECGIECTGAANS